MTLPSITEAESGRLREYIERQCGITLGAEKSYLVQTRLQRIAQDQGCESFGELYERLARSANSVLRDLVIDAMTTNETLWFRDRYPFEILRSVVIPELVGRPQRPIRIWSGACSTGQEPYSIAMTIRELCDATRVASPWDFQIVATDLSSQALERARAGRFGSLAMNRGLPQEERDRWFRGAGADSWELLPVIRDMVDFERLNLQGSFDHLGKFDVVFLRYVAIYFTERLKQELLRRIARSMSPGGYLFLGGIESLYGWCDCFEPQTVAGNLYYRLK